MDGSVYIVGTAVLVGLAVLAWLGPSPHALLDRLGSAGQLAGQPHSVRRRVDTVLLDRWRRGDARARVSIAAALLTGGVAAGALIDGLAGALRGLLVAELVVVVTHTVTHTAEARLARGRDDQWREACEILTAELRAGRTAEEAVEIAAVACADLTRVVHTLTMGGDVVVALRTVPDAPAADGLASAWATAHASGAGLAGVVERVLDELVDQLELRQEVNAQLAGPRATARLLAMLPLGGMGLGVLLGVDPVSTLLGTTLGLCCLVVGSLLAIGGVVWVDRLAQQAQVS